ncbi:MAG: Sec-independent protein translocase protein TatB [Campylobacterota bacterium]|nr:Sec-independent protein translocase protein TatB [Campylobacterota bacterium]
MFGLGFTEIMIIAIIAILFLGPDKLPSAMVDIAKFFRNAKNTIGNVKDSLEQEINVSEIKEEALAYKKELLDAQEKLARVTDMDSLNDEISTYADDMINDKPKEDDTKPAPKQETVTFAKKPTVDLNKKESKNV